MCYLFNRRLLAFISGLVLLAVAACGGGEPQEQTFALEIQDGSLVQEDTVLRVKQDDTVTMVVTADEPVSFHRHGYDIEKVAGPGEPATLEFIADATGSFRFTMHRGPEEHDEDEAAEEEHEGEDASADDRTGDEDEGEIDLGRMEVRPR